MAMELVGVAVGAGVDVGGAALGVGAVVAVGLAVGLSEAAGVVAAGGALWLGGRLAEGAPTETHAATTTVIAPNRPRRIGRTADLPPLARRDGCCAPRGKRTRVCKGLPGQDARLAACAAM
jgi:hypothetical protein